MLRREQPRYAWRYVDVLTLALTTALGAGAWLAAWIGMEPPAAQHRAAWLNLGVAGLTTFGAGNALWLLRGRRAVGERRLSIVRLDRGPQAPRAAAVAPSVAAGPGLVELVQVPGGRLSHRASCPLVEGKVVVTTALIGTNPCRVCGS
jgi:hypothetical protein